MCSLTTTLKSVIVQNDNEMSSLTTTLILSEIRYRCYSTSYHKCKLEGRIYKLGDIAYSPIRTRMNADTRGFFLLSACVRVHQRPDQGEFEYSPPKS